MIDIYNKKCIEENCDKQPIFNYENEKIALYISILLSEFKNKYSYGIQWNQERIKNDEINLPIDENNEINYNFIINLINKNNL